jgi:hypothetical protein
MFEWIDTIVIGLIVGAVASGRNDSSAGDLSRSKKASSLSSKRRRTWTDGPVQARAQEGLLLAVDEVAAAVLLPAGFIRLAAEWFFLSVADGLDVVGTYPTLH